MLFPVGREPNFRIQPPSPPISVLALRTLASSCQENQYSHPCACVWVGMWVCVWGREHGAFFSHVTSTRLFTCGFCCLKRLSYSVSSELSTHIFPSTVKAEKNLLKNASCAVSSLHVHSQVCALALMRKRKYRHRW